MSDEQCLAEKSAAELILSGAEAAGCIRVVDDQWQGMVCIFVAGKQRVYAWRNDGHEFSFLHTDRVNSPIAAVNAWLDSR